MTYLWFFSYGSTSLAWYVLVLAFSIALYRSVRLRSLPWIIGCYALGILASWSINYVGRKLYPSGIPRLADHLHPVSWMLMATPLIEAAGDLLIAVPAFSEVAFLVSRAFPDIHSRFVALLLRAHRHVTFFGVAACAVTVAEPVVAALSLWIQGPVTQ